MRKLLFLAAMLWSAQAYAFDMNVTRDDVQRVKYGYLIGDLMVGDKGYVSNQSFCVENKKLFLSARFATQEKMTYSVNLVAEILPKRTVSITLHDYDDKLDRIGNAIPNPQSCDTVRLYFPDAELLSVKSINGFDNMRDYIGFLKKEGFEFGVNIN